MLQGSIYHRIRAVLHLWTLQCLLPVSLTFVLLKSISKWWFNYGNSTFSTEKAKSSSITSVDKDRQEEKYVRSYTVVMTGGKMSKTLHLARCLRSFQLSDPTLKLKIVVLESQRFRYSATRFSRCVDHFEVITSPRDSPKSYMDGIYSACKKYKATHFLPVAAPAEAVYDAKLKERLEDELGVAHLHMNSELCDILDNKHSFGCFLRDTLKLQSLRTHQVSSNEEVRKYNKLFREERNSGKLRRSMILKNLSYDPIHRLDLFQLPCSDEKLNHYLERVIRDGNPITEEEPWQLQEFLSSGIEYAAMIVVRKNHLVTMTCCPSSASQLNYIHTEIAPIRNWLNDFMKGLKNSKFTLTGQLCFDFMVVTEANNKQVAYPIECNPRVHTQCTIYNRDDVRAALGSLLLENNEEREKLMIELLKRDYAVNKKYHEMPNVYWFYNEFFKIVPNSWLFAYNGANDFSERSKILEYMNYQVGYPSVGVIVTGLVYLPAIFLSFAGMLPVLIVMLVVNLSKMEDQNSDLSFIEHCLAMFCKASFFFDRLVHLQINIEGDLWEYDPVPFLAKNHIQVASRLMASIRSGIEWKKIDFAIGKVVEVGGD
mmetsp:Transcript_34190/g.38909  ORF Transcript_34190/g.38909 Transcript_34190/m.38909 type:complete len:598 (+) Transcript_34190:69-1862(+)